jgi:hypothetical protein
VQQLQRANVSSIPQAVAKPILSNKH